MSTPSGSMSTPSGSMIDMNTFWAAVNGLRIKQLCWFTSFGFDPDRKTSVELVEEELDTETLYRLAAPLLYVCNTGGILEVLKQRGQLPEGLSYPRFTGKISRLRGILGIPKYSHAAYATQLLIEGWTVDRISKETFISRSSANDAKTNLKKSTLC